MKRIYYGNITVDVADSLAAVLADVIKIIGDRQSYRTKSHGNGSYSSEAFATGDQQFVTIAGYVNNSENESNIDLWVGGSVPIAISNHFPSKNDPSGTNTTIEVLRSMIPGE